MLLYDQLPVFKACYDLLLDVFLTTKNLNKEYKYTLGEDLKKEVIALLMGIYKANSYQDKRNMLQEARDRVAVDFARLRASYVISHPCLALQPLAMLSGCVILSVGRSLRTAHLAFR